MRTAVRAQSIAVLPPPTMATRLPSLTGVPRFTSLKKSTPPRTPGSVSPGTPRGIAWWAPTPTNTAL